MTDSAIRAALVHQFAEGRDLDETHAIYHDDAVLEFPQSGERFVGREAFLAWRRKYPAKVDYRIRRITGSGDLWISELLVSYNGSPPAFGVGIHRFRGDRIAHEAVYVTDAFEPAAWRSEWSTPFDPRASIAPSEWRDDLPFGIEPR